MNSAVWLDEHTPFPSPFADYTDPDGLVAIGGDLSPDRILTAYRSGIFPWYEEGQPVLWWSPDPRAVLRVDEIHISRSLRKTLRRGDFTVSFNQRFAEVIGECAAARKGRESTWITGDMRAAYIRLHELGHAVSVEVSDENGRLTGGLYGIRLSQIFCGESMFHRATDMSKVALVALGEWLRERNIDFIDCQLPNAHLMSLGAFTLPKRDFLEQLLMLKEEDY